MIAPRWTSTAPIGMPPSAPPRSASSMAAARNGSVMHVWYAFGTPPHGGLRTMLNMALVFLVIGIVAALLGFTTIAGATFGIAKFLAALFLILFLVFLIIGISATTAHHRLT